MKRVLLLLALMLALVVVSTACSSPSVPLTTTSAQPTTVVVSSTPTDQVRVVMTQIVTTPPPPTQVAKEFSVCTGAEGSYGWSVPNAEKRAPAFYYGPGTELVAERTTEAAWVLAGGYYIPAIKVSIGKCPPKPTPTPIPTSQTGGVPPIVFAAPIFPSGPVNPANPPPYKSVDYLGKWVANARQLLQSKMSPADFQKAMKAVDEAANLAARSGNGLKTTSKLLWRLIQSGKIPMLIIVINPCAGADEPETFDVQSNRAGVSVLCSQLFGFPPAPILF